MVAAAVRVRPRLVDTVQVAEAEVQAVLA